MQTATNYWNERKAREKRAREARELTNKRVWDDKVARNAVATVLPGVSYPHELDAYPVRVVNGDGTITVCNYLV